MTDGPTGIASTVVDSLKGQPLSLALVVMNVLLLGYLYYTGAQAATFRETEMKLMYENREKVAQLLYQCQPSAPR